MDLGKVENLCLEIMETASSWLYVSRNITATQLSNMCQSWTLLVCRHDANHFLSSSACWSWSYGSTEAHMSILFWCTDCPHVRRLRGGAPLFPFCWITDIVIVNLPCWSKGGAGRSLCWLDTKVKLSMHVHRFIRMPKMWTSLEIYRDIQRYSVTWTWTGLV